LVLLHQGKRTEDKIKRKILFYIYLTFFLKKSYKNSRLDKNAGVSKAEVSPRNTRHDAFMRCLEFVVAVYCYAHAVRTYLYLRTTGAFF